MQPYGVREFINNVFLYLYFGYFHGANSIVVLWVRFEDELLLKIPLKNSNNHIDYVLRRWILPIQCRIRLNTELRTNLNESYFSRFFSPQHEAYSLSNIHVMQSFGVFEE